MPPRPLRGALQGSYIYAKGEIPGDKVSRRDGYWQIADGVLYITCVACGKILNVSSHGVSKAVGAEVSRRQLKPDATYGVLNPCAVCTCQTHIFPYLEDYDGEDQIVRYDDGDDDDQNDRNDRDDDDDY